MSARIANRCPACGGAALIVGDGGYLTCGLIGCTDPLAVERVLPHDPHEARQRRDALAACEAERDALLASEAHAHAQWSEERARAERYREALEWIGREGRDSDEDEPAQGYDLAEHARDALRGDS